MEAKIHHAKLGAAAVLAVIGGLFLSLMAVTSTARAETPLPDADEDFFYEVATCQDLQNIGYDLALDYELTGSIDCSVTDPEDDDFDGDGPWSDGYGFYPLGDTGNRYQGEFDGHGFSINGLYIYREMSYAGLFAVIDEGASVHDLNLNNVDITAMQYVGALAGALSGTVTNVDITGHVVGYFGYVGGLTGIHIAPAGIGSSSPLVYTWNGEEYEYVADVGRGIPRNVVGNDSTPLDEGVLVPEDGAYSMKVSQEYNEIVYYDELALQTYDHAPGYDVATSLVRADRDTVFTIADEPSHPLLSCTDAYGNDCLDELQSFDDQWSHEDPSYLNTWTMDFGDLSGAEHVRLVVKGARDFSLDGESLRLVQVKDAEGNWVDAYTASQVSSLGGTPLNRIIDLTGKFVSDDYSVRIGLDRTRVNSFAIDTSEQVPTVAATVHPSSVDLSFRGYTAIDKEFYWNHDYDTVSSTPEELFATQSGNFTKYGDVTPLLDATDDQFVVMHHGDHMDVSFPASAPEEGMERSFVLYSWATFKHASTEAGRTVDPLPFNGMSAYPYPETESYPMTEENIAYLEEWNTRVVTGNPGAGSTIVDSSSRATVENLGESSYIGGLVGYNEKLITGSYATGDVSGFAYVGGLVGSNEYGGEIVDSYATGDVEGYSRVGGFAGLNESGEAYIHESYATGDASGYEYVGGFVGQNHRAISNSYARGSATGLGGIGGFAGACGGGGFIEDSFSTGSVDGEEAAGGFLGYMEGECSVSDSFWDVETSGMEGSDDGIGLPTEVMKAEGFFIEEAGWDFEGIWGMESSQNNGYPYLQELYIERGGGTSVTAPSAVLSLPNGGETLLHGTTYLIFYGVEGSNVQEARLSLSLNGGTTWATIADHQTLGGGYFVWTVPDEDTDDALIRVEAVTSGTAFASDVSDATFTIEGSASDEDADEEEEEENIGSSGQDGVVLGDPDFDLLFVRPDPLPSSTACTAGSRIKGSSEAVYYCGDDGMRHAFPNVAVYHSWFTDFSGIVTITDEELSRIPLGRNMTYRSGSRLIKIQTDPRVYLVERGAVLRPIEDEETAILFFGPDWARFVDDVDVSFFEDYTMGEMLRKHEFTGHVTLIR